MTERTKKKPADRVERAVATTPTAKPEVRLNGKPFDYAGEAFNPKTMATVLRNRKAVNERA